MNRIKRFFKYFTYTLVYLVVSVASAYGVITLSVNNSSKHRGSGMTTEVPLPPQLTAIVDNLTSSDALQLDLSAFLSLKNESAQDEVFASALTTATSENNFDYKIDLDATVDLHDGFENIKVEGTLNLLIGESNQNITINILYADKNIYLDMYNGKFEIETTGFIDAVKQIITLLNIQMPDLGLEISTLDMNTILGFLSNLEELPHEENQPITLKITVPMIDEILTLICDNNYYLNKLQFSYDDQVSANVNATLDYPDNANISDVSSKEYIKINNLLEPVEGAIRYFNDKFVGFDLDVKYNDSNFNGQIFANLNSPTAIVTSKVKDKPLNLIYEDKVVYLEFQNVLAKFNIVDYKKITSLLKNCFGIDIPVDKINNIITLIKNKQYIDALKELNLDNFSLDSLDLSALENVYVEDNITYLVIKNIGEIGLGIVDDKLNQITFNGHGVVATLKTIPFEKYGLKSQSQDYVDLAQALPTIENGIQILQNNSLNGDINLNINGFDIPISLKKFEDYLKIEITPLDYSIKIEKLLNKIYIDAADRFKLVVDTDTFADSIVALLNGLNREVNLDGLLGVVGAVAGLVNLDESTLLLKDLQQTENGLNILLFNDIEINIVNGSDNIVITSSSNEFSLDATLCKGDETINIPTFNDEEYNSVDQIFEIVKKFINSGLLDALKGAYNTFSSKVFGVEFEGKYDGHTIKGKFNADLVNAKANISLNIEGEKVNLILIDKIVYFEYKNIFIKFPVVAFVPALTFVNEQFGLGIDTDAINELLGYVSEKDYEGLVTNILDEYINKTFRLDSIDLSFFDNIRVEGDDTIIPVKDGIVTLTVTEQQLTNIAFNGYGVEFSSTVAGYDEGSLAQEDYVDLAEFADTAKNAVEIAKSKLIKGEFSISVKINEKIYKLPINLTIYSGEKVYANLVVEVEGYKLNISYLDGKVYVNAFDRIKVMSIVANFEDELKAFLEEINVSVDTKKVIGAAVGVILPYLNNEAPLIASVVKGDTGLDITLFNGLTVSITNGTKELSLSTEYGKVKFEGKISGCEDTISIPTFDDEEYDQVASVFEIAKKFINSGLFDVVVGSYNAFSKGKIAFNFSLTYNKNIEATEDNNNDTIKVKDGNINIDILSRTLYLTAKVEGYQLSVILLNSVIYLQFENIFLKFGFTDLPDVYALINTYSGLKIPEFITILMEGVENGDIEGAIKNIIKTYGNKGTTLDLDKFDTSFFDKVKKGNEITLPFDENNSVKVALANKILTGIDYVGNGINLNSTTTTYKDVDITSTKSIYIDLSKFLPTIENALGLSKCGIVTGHFDVINESIHLPIDIKINQENERYMELDIHIATKSLNPTGSNILIQFYKENVFITIANNIKIFTDLQKLPSDLENLLQGLDSLIPATSLNGLISKINDILKEKPSLFLGVQSFLGETPRGEDILDNVTLYEDQNRLIVTLYNNLSYIITNTMNENELRIDLTTVHGNTSYEGYFKNSGEVVVPTLSTKDFIPIENVFGLVNAAKNMAIKYSYFHITGNFEVNAKLINKLIKKNVPLDIYVRKVGRDVEMKIELNPLPGIGILMEDSNDKIDTIYYKNGDLYLIRKSDETKFIKTTLSSFGAHPTYYLKFLTTFSKFIIDAIDDSIENKMKKRGPISLSDAITGFTAETQTKTENDVTTTEDVIGITLNMAVITNDSSFTNTQFTINIGKDEAGDTILANASFGLNLLGFLDLKTSDLKLNDYSVTDKELDGLADFVGKYNGVDYDTEYTISGEGENEKATNPQVNSVIDTYTITFDSQGGENVPSITKTANSPITLPKTSKEPTDDGKEKLTYTFVGWYTKDNVEFTSDKMPKQNLTLYAKWEVTSEIYEGVNSHRVEIYYQNELVYANNHAEGSVIDMRLLSNCIGAQTHYYLDSAFEQEVTENINGTMLTVNGDITLYIRGKYVLTLSSTYGTFTPQTFEIWEGEKIEISVPSIADYENGDTKYEFNGFTIPEIMPAENTTIYADWTIKYKVKFNYDWYIYEKFDIIKQGTPQEKIDEIPVWVEANGIINDFTPYFIEILNVKHDEWEEVGKTIFGTPKYDYVTRNYVFKCESFSTDKKGKGTVYESTSIYKVTEPVTLHAVWTYVSGPD